MGVLILIALVAWSSLNTNISYKHIESCSRNIKRIAEGNRNESPEQSSDKINSILVVNKTLMPTHTITVFSQNNNITYNYLIHKIPY
jgi:hypothetical protein